jgi:phage-related protein
MPISRPMGGGLHDVRSSLPGNRIARVLYCVEEGRMILLHVFIKKTRATPKTWTSQRIERRRSDNEQDRTCHAFVPTLGFT